MKTQIINVEVKYTGWTRLLVARVRLPNGQIVQREIEDHGPAVAVLPYDPERKTAILVKQFRAPVFFSCRQEHMFEVIAGIQEDTNPAAAARREALEEAGLVLNALEHIATLWTMPGVSTEQMTLYLAAYRQTDRTQEGGGIPTEHEIIAVTEMELAELCRLMDSGQIADMKTLVLVQALKLRHPGLFK